MLCPCIFCVALLLFGETIRIVFRCGCCFLLNVMDAFSVGGGALLDIPSMVFHRICVMCL